jgi:hypothetical protein
MADITAIFLILVSVGVAFPGMLTAWWLLFPDHVERARLRIESTPWKCFWLGLAILAVVGVPVFILLALPFGPAKFLGWVVLAAALTVSGFGSAGISAHMGRQLTRSASSSALGGFVRGAVVLELAAVFPVLGWFFIFPLALVTAFGATGFALLNWLPRAPVVRSTPESAALQA